MKVLVFGATGGTGRELVRQSIEKNYETSAFIHKGRNSKAKMAHEVKLFYGDVLDYDSVDRAADGQDVVLVALGTRPGVSNKILSDGTINIIKAMQKNNVKRIIVETGAGLIEDRSKLPVSWRLLSNIPFMKDMFAAKRIQESAIMKSNLDWIIVRPANLTNGPLTKQYNIDNSLNLKANSTISRANVAHCMIDQIESDKYLNQTIVISEK